MGSKKDEDVNTNLIRRALDSTPVDIKTIFEIANKHGLPPKLRAKCWLEILHVEEKNITPPVPGSHKEQDIVTRDVERSMWSWGGCDHPVHLRSEYRSQLQVIINGVLGKHQELHYYQGYHDVATVLLMCTNDMNHAYALLERLSTSYLRESMNPSLDEVIQELYLLQPLLKMVDEEVFNFIKESGVEPFFAVSWALTWFSHNLENDPKRLYRLFDFFITSHPLQVIYFAAALVVQMRDTILNVECEMSYVHSVLGSLPKKITVQNLESLISFSRDLFRAHPVQELRHLAPEGKRIKEGSSLLNFPYPWMKKTRHLFATQDKSLSIPIVSPITNTIKDYFLNQWSYEQIAVIAIIGGLIAFSAYTMRKS